MSDLIVIAYDDVGSATAARDKLIDLQRQNLITLEDAAVVERRDNGKIKLHQVRNMTASGAMGGMLWGGLIGLLFFMPFLGMALGGATGAAVGSTSDLGVDDSFMKELGTKLQPGGAALFLLVLRSTPEKVVPEVARYGGHIMSTSLTTEQEASLRDLAQNAGQPVAG
jgi:uncharacterized membrane protein